ncbi:MAG: hypothetical protein RIQ99_1764, partial [Pseudomonadota bacterium]
MNGSAQAVLAAMLVAEVAVFAVGAALYLGGLR